MDGGVRDTPGYTLSQGSRLQVVLYQVMKRKEGLKAEKEGTHSQQRDSGRKLAGVWVG